MEAAYVVLMVLGTLVLWIGAPVGWLWVGSQVQADSSVGKGITVAFCGFFVTVAALVPMLIRVNRAHAELRARRDPPPRYTALEVIFVVSAGLALASFAGWFFLFSGSSPAPINLGY